MNKKYQFAVCDTEMANWDSVRVVSRHTTHRAAERRAGRRSCGGVMFRKEGFAEGVHWTGVLLTDLVTDPILIENHFLRERDVYLDPSSRMPGYFEFTWPD